MESCIKNRVNHELRINANILMGTVSLDMLLNYLENLVKEIDYDDTYNVLVDVREADMPDFFERIDEFINFFMNSSKAVNWRRKCAIVTSNAKHVVISELLKYKMQKVNFKLIVEVFSTQEAALRWLNF